MCSKQCLLLLLSAWLVSGQRPSFAGFKPIGFPEVTTSEDPIGNRFGDSTEKLPVEAKGDRDLVNRLSKLPIDQQPFWYINWKAIEENNKNPQTYPQRGNSFTEQNVSGGSNSSGASNSGIPNNQPNSGDLASKFGVVDNANQNSLNGYPQRPNYQNRGQSTVALQVEGQRNGDVVSRVWDWIVEHQPFWYIKKNITENNSKTYIE